MNKSAKAFADVFAPELEKEGFSLKGNAFYYCDFYNKILKSVDCDVYMHGSDIDVLVFASPFYCDINLGTGSGLQAISTNRISMTENYHGEQSTLTVREILITEDYMRGYYSKFTNILGNDLFAVKNMQDAYSFYEKSIQREYAVNLSRGRTPERIRSYSSTLLWGDLYFAKYQQALKTIDDVVSRMFGDKSRHYDEFNYKELLDNPDNSDPSDISVLYRLMMMLKSCIMHEDFDLLSQYMDLRIENSEKNCRAYFKRYQKLCIY